MKTPEEIVFAHGKASAEANKPRCLPPIANMMQRCDITLRIQEFPAEQMAAIDKAWGNRVRSFTIIGGVEKRTLEADYLTHANGNVYFWQRGKRWWQRDRIVGVADWRYCAVIDSCELKTDGEIAREMGVQL